MVAPTLTPSHLRTSHPSHTGTGRASSRVPLPQTPVPEGHRLRGRSPRCWSCSRPQLSERPRANGSPSLGSCTDMGGDRRSLRPHLGLRPPPPGVAWGPPSSWPGSFRMGTLWPFTTLTSEDAADTRVENRHHAPGEGVLVDGGKLLRPCRPGGQGVMRGSSVSQSGLSTVQQVGWKGSELPVPAGVQVGAEQTKGWVTVQGTFEVPLSCGKNQLLLAWILHGLCFVHNSSSLFIFPASCGAGVISSHCSRGVASEECSDPLGCWEMPG